MQKSQFILTEMYVCNKKKKIKQVLYQISKNTLGIDKPHSLNELWRELENNWPKSQ